MSKLTRIVGAAALALTAASCRLEDATPVDRVAYRAALSDSSVIAFYVTDQRVEEQPIREFYCVFNRTPEGNLGPLSLATGLVDDHGASPQAFTKLCEQLSRQIGRLPVIEPGKSQVISHTEYLSLE
jgi:hypothetical protein